MPQARIYQPAKTATQSGRGNTHHWILEYEPAVAKTMDPLMGWIGSSDTLDQVRLAFKTKEDAVGFARSNGLEFRVREPHARHVRPKNYTDNFSYRRPR